MTATKQLNYKVDNKSDNPVLLGILCAWLVYRQQMYCKQYT